MTHHPPRILLVDDDADLSALLREYLEREGFAVEAVFNGVDGVAQALGGGFDAVILDVMLPRLNGIEALRQIRATSMVPVLMLTAKGDQVDRVVGLELGADDYVAKPYYPRELVARLRAILRRRAPDPALPVAAEARRLTLGPLDVQVAARRAAWQGTSLDLTPSEFNILVALLRAGEDVATKDVLSLQGLGRPRQSYDRSVDVHVSNLRLKLEAATAATLGIETVRGVGYRLALATARPGR
ncbi:response regulator transcription factor [Novosphingobium sp. SG720]|uniref:response regulator transcription factor n=1 Tax=Novosphingobium sp. SG720 TaxID=2586998 RepID=UPI0014475D62|nr:response regulator transcription factor [Novosphingobium sp. SG720]NKJ42035.1 two-component system OmpR family response regulator [Novosphingobium sp. SG720]